MTKVVLIRHGRSTANAEGVLAGRADGVALDETGRAQARRLAEVLASAPIVAAYTSPIQRCRETAALAGFPQAQPVEGLTECDYGRWTGAKLDSLKTERVWEDIQLRPSAVSFPGGESMVAMFARTTKAVLELTARHTDEESIVLFSHGDPIKAILAHAFGMGFDDFQRVHVNPAGASIVDYRGDWPRVLCVNVGEDLGSHLLGSTSAVPGGGDVTTPPPQG